MITNTPLGRSTKISINGVLWDAIERVEIKIYSSVVDITTRGDGGRRVYVPGRREIQLNILAQQRDDDPVLRNILNSCFADPPDNLLTVVISESPFPLTGSFFVSYARLSSAGPVEIVLKPSAIHTAG